MQWQQLIVFIVPLVTAWIAFRSSGSRRWVAVVGTFASAGHYALGLLPETARIVPPAMSLVLFAIGLVAILILSAGTLHHPSQWLAVGVGALAVAIFFAALAFSATGDLEFLPLELSGALLTGGVAVIMGVPKLIDVYLKARKRPSGGGEKSWHPSQWAAVGIGAMAIVGAVILFATPRFRWLIDKDTFLVVCFAGLLTIAIVPRLIGYALKTRAARGGEAPAARET